MLISKKTLNLNFFPALIQQISAGIDRRSERKIIETEVQFELEKWLNPVLTREFGIELVTEAVINLKLSFRDLTTVQTFQENSVYPQIPATNHLSWKANVSKNVLDDNSRHWKTIYVTEFHCQIPSDLHFGEIFRECLLLQEPTLRAFETKEIIEFDPYKFFNEYVKLVTDLPQELRHLPLDEIAQLDGIQRIERRSSAFDCYSLSGDFDKYQFYLETDIPMPEDTRRKSSLYIPYNAWKNRDFTIIEAHMQAYWKSYYGTNEARINSAMSVFSSPIVMKFRAEYFKN